MGGYSCSWPYLQFEANDQQKEVIALSCSNPGCPGSTTAQRTSTLPCSAGTPEGDGEYSDGSVIWVRGMTCEAALALIEPHHSELVGKRAGTTYVLDGFRCKVVYPGGPDFVDECVAGSRASTFSPEGAVRKNAGLLLRTCVPWRNRRQVRDRQLARP